MDLVKNQYNWTQMELVVEYGGGGGGGGDQLGHNKNLITTLFQRTSTDFCRRQEFRKVCLEMKTKEILE